MLEKKEEFFNVTMWMLWCRSGYTLNQNFFLLVIKWYDIGRKIRFTLWYQFGEGSAALWNCLRVAETIMLHVSHCYWASVRHQWAAPGWSSSLQALTQALSFGHSEKAFWFVKIKTLFDVLFMRKCTQNKTLGSELICLQQNMCDSK